MANKRHRVAIIGCGRLGQYYAEAYTTYPDTEIVAIAEFNPERREQAGKKFGVSSIYANAEDLLNDVVPDIAAIVTPSKHYKDAVIACAKAGVKAISTDKPIAAKLSDVDEMIDTCRSQGSILAGGILQRAMNENQEVADRLKSGVYGEIKGASVHAWGGEISGGGCQHISVLRLLLNSEISEVTTWGTHLDLLKGEVEKEEAIKIAKESMYKKEDLGVAINGSFKMENGILTNVYGLPTPSNGVEVWTDNSLIKWEWAPPKIFSGFDANGNRIEIDPKYSPYKWSEFGYRTGTIRSLIKALETGSEPWVTGHDLRQALEAAIASRISSQLGNVPVKLPLKDRTLSLYPRPYRWEGGDVAGGYRSDFGIV